MTRRVTRGDPVACVLHVVAAGPQLLVQDLGRPGWSHLGVGRSGAADRWALRLANRLVGNAEDAAALEVLLGGAALRFAGGGLAAVTGARLRVRVGDVDRHQDGPLEVADGDELWLGLAERGLRAYVAVRGGLDVAPVLGSCAADTLSGLGPPPLQDGDAVPVRVARTPWPGVDQAPVPEAGEPVVLRVLPGPRDDWFADGTLDVLARSTWTVSSDTDRVGTRLEGPELLRRVGGELASEGMVRGALQVPPHGRPVVMGPDHPVTGGYPVVATVVDADADLLAQARPGAQVRFQVG